MLWRLGERIRVQRAPAPGHQSRSESHVFETGTERWAFRRAIVMQWARNNEPKELLCEYA